MSKKIVNIKDMYAVENNIVQACELFFICEIGKSLNAITFNDDEYKLSIKGITFNEQLKQTPYWYYLCHAVDKGWLVDADASIDAKKGNYFDERRVQDIKLVRKKVDLKGVKYEKNEFPIVYQCLGEGDPQFFFSDVENTELFSKGLDYQTWVSVLAYFTVMKYFHIHYNHKMSAKLFIRISNNTLTKYNALSYLMLLQENSNIGYWVNLIIVKSILTEEGKQSIETPMEESDVSNVKYESWIQDGIDKGCIDKYLANGNDHDKMVAEKLQQIKELNIEVGDVLALYKRNASNKRKSTTGSVISDMKFVVVRKITKNDILLEEIHNTQTKLDIKCEIAQLNREQQEWVLNNRLLDRKTRLNKMDLAEIGINQSVYKEEYFITTLDQIQEQVSCFVKKNDERPHKVKVDIQKYLQWILNEYEIDYNEEKYKKLYLK